MSHPLYIDSHLPGYLYLGPGPLSSSPANDAYYYSLGSYGNQLTITNSASLQANADGFSIVIPKHPFGGSDPYTISVQDGATLAGGIEFGDDGGILNNDGLINGPIDVNGYLRVTINNSGTINGGINLGAATDANSRIYNHGFINYVNIESTVGFFENYGTVDGIHVFRGAQLIDNSGTVDGSVTIQPAGTVHNYYQDTFLNEGIITGNLYVGGVDDVVSDYGTVDGTFTLGREFGDYRGAVTIRGLVGHGLDVLTERGAIVHSNAIINGGVTLAGNDITFTSVGYLTGATQFGGLHVSGDSNTASLSGYFAGGGDISGTQDRLIVSQEVHRGTDGQGNLLTITNGPTLELAGPGSSSAAASGSLSRQLPVAGQFSTIIVDPTANWVIDQSSVVSNALIDDGVATLSAAQTVGVTLDGTLVNQADLTGSIKGQGTILDSGTITGDVSFTGAGLLSLTPESGFYGSAHGDGYNSTLLLGAGGTTGSLRLSSITNFGQITIENGGNWVVDGSIAAATSIVDDGTLVNFGGTLAGGVQVGDGGALSNFGMVGTADAATGGVELTDGGALTNALNGTITGTYGAYGLADPTTITNAGLIYGAGRYDGTSRVGNAVALFGGGNLTNTDTGTISGVGGVYLGGTGNDTLTNAGTIIGTDHAVQFGSGDDSLILVAGETLIGAVEGGSGSDTIVLNAGTVPGYLQLSSLSNFAEITVSAGADWVVGGSLPAATVLADSGTLSNAGGTLSGGVTLAGGAKFFNSGTSGAIVASGGGEIDNTSGTIEGAGIGIYVQSGAAEVINAGQVIGGDGAIRLEDGGTLTNDAGSTITGTYGLYGLSGVTTITNSGVIDGTGRQNGGGLYGNAIGLFGGGGRLTNTATGTITGFGGVVLAGSGNDTLTNAGTITGISHAVQFGSGNDRLIVDPGAVFQGSVYGGSASDDVLELASSSNTGLLYGLGSQINSFETLVVDKGASWVLSETTRTGASVSNEGTLIIRQGPGGDLPIFNSLNGDGVTNLQSGVLLEVQGSVANAQKLEFGGNDAILQLDETATIELNHIYGFNSSDALDLRGLTYAPDAAAILVGEKLIVTSDGVTDTFTLDGVPAGTLFRATDDGTPAHGTLVEEVTCYCRGTRILTDRGEVPVEQLAIGDVLVTHAGAARPIKWIGQRSYAGWLAAGNAAVWPVCFAPGSLAHGVPKRELRVSPEHAMFLDGVLVPAGLLVNGTSIRKSAPLDEVHYYHLELDSHDVILAEGAAAETFVDDDSRGIFHNAADFHARYPDAARAPALYCAPRVEDGFELDAIRRRLDDRATRLAADDAPADDTTAAAADEKAAARLAGYLDAANRRVLKGWVRDRAAPDQRVSLTVFDNGLEIGRLVADRFRADLAKRGIGDGCHSFVFHLPDDLPADAGHSFELRSAGGWVLPVHRTCCPVLEPKALAGTAVATAAPACQSQAVPYAAASPGPLRGNLDVVSRSRLLGWVVDDTDAERPVPLVASANGRVIARVLANAFRRDLQSAGIGSGRHGFVIRIPAGLLGLESQEIRLARELDGAELCGSPFHLPALRTLDADTETQMSALFAGLPDDVAEARGLALLARETEALLERRAARHGQRAERAALARHRRRWGPDTADLPADLVPATRPQALVIDLHAPCLGRDGGSVAILSHMRALVALGYAVSFAASQGDLAEDARADLLQAGIAVHEKPFYAGVEDVLRLHAGTFDLIYLHRHECADRYLALARAHAPKARVVYSVADLHHVRLARQSHVERRPELLAYSRKLAAIEAHAAARADVVLTHSVAEAQVLRQVAGFGRVHVVPFAVAARPGRRRFAERHGLAFIGSFGHAPNADAVYVLTRDIMPLVWAQDPSIICRIVGHGWTAARLPGLDPRIQIIGHTDDLDGLLDSVRLTVAPLRFGAGIKAKVLDSFAAGVPCVMTGIAAEGLPLTGLLGDLVADDMATLASHILRLHANQAANERTGAAAIQLMADDFGSERVTETLGKALLAPAAAQHRRRNEEDQRATPEQSRQFN